MPVHECMYCMYSGLILRALAHAPEIPAISPHSILLSALSVVLKQTALLTSDAVVISCLLMLLVQNYIPLK